MTDETLLTVAEVATRLRTHPITVRRWLNAGRLHGFRPGGTKTGWRIRASELERFIAEREGSSAGRAE
jgi:excisionase family DNA binding protein